VQYDARLTAQQVSSELFSPNIAAARYHVEDICNDNNSKRESRKIVRGRERTREKEIVCDTTRGREGVRAREQESASEWERTTNRARELESEKTRM